MPRQSADIDALVRDLTDFQKEMEVDGLLRRAVAEPLSTEERFRPIEQALEAFKGISLSGRDDSGDLQLLVNIGQTYEGLSHTEKAYETYVAALAMAERLGDTRNGAMLLNRMGRVLSRWNRWAEALDHLERSQEAYRALGDGQGLARVVLSRGIVSHQQGDYEAAATAYREALDLAQTAGDQRTAANAINGLAVLATIRGDFDEAITRYETCMAMFQDAGNLAGLARTYHNLGMTHADRRDWKSAMDSYERGFEIAQEQGLLEVMANIHLSRAELLLELGDSSMVALCCTRALDIYRKTENRLGEADTNRVMGRVFALRRRWPTALSLFQDALRLNEEYHNPLNAAETHRDLGNMHASRGHKTEARSSFEAALAGFRSLGAKVYVAEVEHLISALSAS